MQRRKEKNSIEERQDVCKCSTRDKYFSSNVSTYVPTALHHFKAQNKQSFTFKTSVSPPLLLSLFLSLTSCQNLHPLLSECLGVGQQRLMDCWPARITSIPAQRRLLKSKTSFTTWRFALRQRDNNDFAFEAFVTGDMVLQTHISYL